MTEPGDDAEQADTERPRGKPAHRAAHRVIPEIGDALAAKLLLPSSSKAQQDLADKLSRLTAPARNAVPPRTQHFMDTQRDLERQREDLSRLLGDSARAQRDAERAKVDREEKALQLSAGILEHQQRLVETQAALLNEQIRQGQDAERDRRLEFAVLVMAVVAIAATVATSISAAWWLVLASTVGTLLICTGLAVLIIRGRRRG